MNLKTVKEIISRPTQANVSDLPLRVAADGWLDCYSQISPLVAALEKIRSFHSDFECGVCGSMRVATEALKEYKRLMGEGK